MPSARRHKPETGRPDAAGIPIQCGLRLPDGTAVSLASSRAGRYGPCDCVTGGGIIHHARRPVYLVAAAQNFATYVLLPVVPNDVMQAANDKQQIQPVLEEDLERLPGALGKTETLLADSSYFSEANVTACAEAKIAPLIPPRPRTPPSPLEGAVRPVSAGTRGGNSIAGDGAPGWRRPKAGKPMPCASRRRNRCSASSSR